MITDGECNDQVPQQDQSRENRLYPSLVARQVPHKVDHIKDTHADVQIQGEESSSRFVPLLSGLTYPDVRLG